MHLHILTFIILPNLGYLKGSEMVNKKYLFYTKKVLMKIDHDCMMNFYVYRLDGVIHREHDLPSIIWKNGTKEWYKKGERHRKGDLPAIEWFGGRKDWYKRGQLHRKGDLPAIKWDYGSKFWYKNGKVHRKGDLPAVIWHEVRKEWWKKRCSSP